MKTTHQTGAPTGAACARPSQRLALHRLDAVAEPVGAARGRHREPPLGAALQERVGDQRDPEDRDHAHRQRVAEPDVVEDVTATAGCRSGWARG